MTKYDIFQRIKSYDIFYEQLDDILMNKNNKFLVTRQTPIGKSECGFDIEHYSIGNGPRHVVYMGGTHGNEIISVDFVLQLMKNLALGKGVFENFNPDLFTIDFIPCQNPEGYFTTTYALKSVMKDMTLEEEKQFCKNYYLDYREDNLKIQAINSIINTCCEKYKIQNKLELIQSFWSFYHNKEFDQNDLCTFLGKVYDLKQSQIRKMIYELWHNKIGNKKVNLIQKKYQKNFENLNLNCIPIKDEKHLNLKKALEKIYEDKDFPLFTLANFLANAFGVNLNDNNEFHFKYLNQRIKKEGVIYANPMYCLPKSKIGPIGTASINKEKFVYAPENQALLNFLEELSNSCYAFFNCHGTGGMLYSQPYYDSEKCDKVSSNKITQNFSFYINNRIATEYLKEIDSIYIEKTGKKDPYKLMGHPNKITGTAEMLRSKYIAHFLLELSNAGGNPLGPYIDPNYELTMEANFNAFMKTLKTILEVEHLYNMTYSIQYDEKGRVIYNEKIDNTRKRIRKINSSKK